MLHSRSWGGHVPYPGSKWGWGNGNKCVRTSRVCPGDLGVPELQERVGAIESQLAQITQLL